MLGDPDQPHTYTYIPDIGEGLAVLGEHPDAAGRGLAPAQRPRHPDDPPAGRHRLPARRPAPDPAPPVSPLLLAPRRLTNPTLRELLEMQYQFEEPFIVDSTKITTRLGDVGHPLSDALADTLATYRDAAR